MKRLLAFVLFALTLATSASAAAKLRVVATTPSLAAVARSVGGSDVKVKTLALHTQDPHWVDARPHLALELAKADLLLAVGLDLEIGWLPTLQTGSRNGDIQTGARGFLDCSTLVSVLGKPTGKVDRSMGDLHPGGDPHYMLDPRRAARVAWGIAKRMAELDPDNAKAYRKRGKKLVKALKKKRKSWEKALAGAKGKRVVAYHRSLMYLADWLGLDVVIHLEPRPGISPNPRHVAHVMSVAKDKDAVAILQESWWPQKTSKLVAKKVGAKVVRIPGGPNVRRGQTYEAFMARVVKKLQRGLR